MQTWHRSAPDGVLELEEEVDTGLISNLKLSPTDCHLQIKILFSPRESHWGNTPAVAGQHKMNSKASLGDSLPHDVKSGHFFTQAFCVHIMTSSFVFLWDSCVCPCVSVFCCCCCLLYFFLWLFFSFDCLCLALNCLV